MISLDVPKVRRLQSWGPTFNVSVGESLTFDFPIMEIFSNEIADEVLAWNMKMRVVNEDISSGVDIGSVSWITVSGLQVMLAPPHAGIFVLDVNVCNSVQQCLADWVVVSATEGRIWSLQNV